MAKSIYLRNIASLIVDQFIVDEKAYNSIIDQALEDHDTQQACQAQKTPDGRFPCRFRGCDRTFRYNGQHRRNHESSHGLFIDDTPPPPSVQSSSSSTEESDDMSRFARSSESE